MIEAKRLRQVLDYCPQTGKFKWRVQLSLRGRVGADAGSLCKKTNRILIRIDGKLYLAHRLAWFHMTGKWPLDLIDHKNGDPSDNRFSNLREASQLQNAKNCCAHRDSHTGIKGVSFDASRKKWIAQLWADGKIRFMKRFDNIDDAKFAYSQASQKYHGEFGRTS